MHATTRPSNGFDPRRTALTLLALWAGGGATIFMLLLSSGYAMGLRGLTRMPEFLPVMHAFARVYVWAVWLPSLVALVLVALYSRRHLPALANRIGAGLGAGALATFVLNFFRQLGVLHGWLPVDSPILFGKMILGPQAQGPTLLLVGLIYHFLNGASFGAFYTLVWGRAHWMWGVFWGLLLELGMMTLPPMAPVFGPFGNRTGSPAYFVITLIAHLGFGIALGLLARRWVREEGSLLALCRRPA